MSSERAETSRRKDGAPRVGVGVMLIDDEQRVLLTLRRRAPEAGCWSILGGKLHFLEKLSECAVPEAREEAGVEVELVRLLCVTDHLLPQEGQHWIAPAYLGRVVSGEAQNREPEKTEEVRWFAMDEVPENLTITAHNAIRTYRQQSLAERGREMRIG